MLSTVFSYVLALLVLGVIIFIHELGHYGVARLFDIKVLEFAVGMGPRLFKWERNDILYSLRAIPIGGFCRFYGEDEAVRDKDSFNAHAPYKRFLVIFAGAFLNLLAAYLLAVAFAGIYGDIVPNIALVSPETPAARAGLMANDRVKAIDGKPVDSSEEIIAAIIGGDAKGINIRVSRDGKPMEFVVRDAYNAEKGYNIVGISLSYGLEPVTVAQAFPAGWRYVRNSVEDIFKFLGGLFTKPVKQGDVMGPVGVVNVIGHAVQTDMMSVLLIAIGISISLGVLNLLPFPGLDGARLVFIVYEGVTGKPVKREVEGWIHFAGIVLLMGLVVIMTYTDIKSLFGG